MSKAPAFQLYSNDFLVDTLDWSIEEIGIYTRLLFYQWANGSIPDDPKRMARIAGCGTNKFIGNSKKVLMKFVKNSEGFLQNLRLEETRKEQIENHIKAVESGTYGANKRWEFHIKKDSTPISNPNSKNIALHSSSSLTTKKEIYKEKRLQVPTGKHLPDFIEKIKCNPAYQHIDIENELSKMDAWLSLPKNSKRKKTPSFILNWLNKIEAPINGNGNQPAKLVIFDNQEGDPFAEEMAAYKRGELK
jgi:uncharacterized protein YdaU (DUF1376 family)